jgi:murein hydrolase activator
MVKKTLILSLLSLTLLTTSVNANELTSLASKISSIKKQIKHDHSQRQQLQIGLSQSEIAASRISTKMTKTHRNLKQQTMLLKNLEDTNHQYHNKLKKQQAILEKQIQTAYILGRQPYLKLLLNQQDTEKVSRFLMYYHYINKNRALAIVDIKQTLQIISNNKEKIQSQHKTLQSLQSKQQLQIQQLQQTKKNRQQLIFLLSKNIQSRQQRLSLLITNKRRLEKAIAQVGNPKAAFPKADLAKLHDRLHWPTRGRVQQLFGTQIEQSELKWGGVLIKAPENQPIYAIASGKVVFSKWLAGYGFLLIISHGNGYMTLYGRNHVLYKKTGDIVRRGDEIATVGQTGGYNHPALYFAVRHNGKPINPARFIKS